MSFPASRDAVRRSYDPQWGREPDLDEEGNLAVGKRCWQVTVKYLVRKLDWFDVEADDLKAAIEAGRASLHDEVDGDDYEIAHISAKEITCQ